MPLTKYWTHTLMTPDQNETAKMQTCAVYVAADADIMLKETRSTLESARDYINGWTGCVPPEDSRSKQWREWKDVNAEVNAALDRLKGTL